MSDFAIPPISSITITVMLDISPSLRALLEQLLARQGVMSFRVPPGVPSAAGERRQAASEPGPAMDVDSLNSPAADQAPPPASFSQPRAKVVAQGGGRQSRYETPERIDWLRSAWWDGITQAHALIELNRLPGPELPAEWAVGKIRARHKLQRSPEARRAAQLAKVAAMVAAQRGNAPLPEPPKPVAAAGSSMPPPKQSLRAMSAAEIAARRTSMPSKPIAATSIEILRWGAEHGCHQQKLDLDAMNAHCRKLGLPEFELITPAWRKAA
jgi:hypothetical protein